MITPSQIRERKLSTVESGGYDRDEINELLLEIIESYEAVYAENKELFRKMEILAKKIEEYREDEDSIKTAIISAQKMADGVVREANAKAEKTISDSNEEAKQTVLDAKSEAEKIVGEARNYVAELTSEKEEAAASIIADAESRANAAIQGAQVVAQKTIDDAKELIKDMIDKAKEEKLAHQNFDEKLKQDAESFKTKLIALYQEQIGILTGENESAADSADAVEETLDELMSTFEAVTADDLSDADEQNAEEEKTEEDEAPQIETDDDEADENESEESKIEEEEVQTSDFDEEIISLEDDEEELESESQEEPETEDADEIIAQLFSESRSENKEEPTDDTEFEELIEEDNDVDISSAVNAFSSDEITPFERGSAIPVVEDDQLPFEAFFNVDKTDPHNTDETISLIPPDDEDEDEDDDDTTKFRGFFKKRK